MKKILTLPTWLIFLFLISPAFFPWTTLAGHVLITLWGVSIAYYVYVLGNSLYERSPVKHDLNVKRFHFLLFYITVYYIITFIIFDGNFKLSESIRSNNKWLAIGIMSLQIFAFYCMASIVWFLAKSISTLEKSKIVGLEASAQNFILLWFLPITIWWVHPALRRIFDMDTKMAHTAPEGR